MEGLPSCIRGVVNLFALLEADVCGVLRDYLSGVAGVIAQHFYEWQNERHLCRFLRLQVVNPAAESTGSGTYLVYKAHVTPPFLTAHCRCRSLPRLTISTVAHVNSISSVTFFVRQCVAQSYSLLATISQVHHNRPNWSRAQGVRTGERPRSAGPASVSTRPWLREQDSGTPQISRLRSK